MSKLPDQALTYRTAHSLLEGTQSQAYISLQGMLGVTAHPWVQEKNGAGSAQGRLCHIPCSFSAPAHLWSSPRYLLLTNSPRMSFSAAGLHSTYSLPSFIHQTANA